MTASTTQRPDFAEAIIGDYLECPKSGQVFRLDDVQYSSTPGEYYFGLHRCNTQSAGKGTELWVNLDRYSELTSVRTF